MVCIRQTLTRVTELDSRKRTAIAAPIECTKVMTNEKRPNKKHQAAIIRPTPRRLLSH